MTPLKNRARKVLQPYQAPIRVIRSVVQPRSTHLFCIGAPKTGTLSVASIFSSHFRSTHEPDIDLTADMLEARWRSEISEDALRRWLRQRDSLLWLECESTHAMAWFSDLLVEVFKDAKFILPVRDCYSWLDSIFNQHLNGSKVRPPYFKLRDLYHGTAAPYESPLLEERGLYPLEGYLSYWARHNEFVMDHVPEDRLLVLPVWRLSRDLDILASFAGVEVSNLDARVSHSHHARKKHHLPKQLGQDLITEKIEQFCSPTIERLSRYEHVEGYDLVGGV